MLDEKDLQAIAQLMDLKLAQQKQEILDESTHRMNILLETKVQTQFKLLAEGQQTILERLPDADQINDNTGRIDMLETVVRKHSMDIRKLQKAN